MKKRGASCVIGLTAFLSSLFFSANSVSAEDKKIKVYNFESIAKVQYDNYNLALKGLDKICFLLEEYKKKKGGYPENIKSLGANIKDPFSNGEYNYASDCKEYLLYSNSLDYIDDEGILTSKIIAKKIENSDAKNQTFENDLVRISNEKSYPVLLNKLVKIKNEKKRAKEMEREKDNEKFAREYMDISMYNHTELIINNLAIILDEYKKRKEGYPEKLEKILPFIKNDLYLKGGTIKDYMSFGSGSNLRYFSNGNDFILYSVGFDKIDNLADLSKVKNVNINGKNYVYEGDMIKYSSKEGFEKLRKNISSAFRK